MGTHALNLYASLAARGFKLSAKAGKILVQPPGQLTTTDRQLIDQHRTDLLSLLGEPVETSAAGGPETAPVIPDGAAGVQASITAAGVSLPDDLPGMLEYRTGTGVVLTALPRRPVESVSSSGKSTAPLVKPTIPYGAVAWRLATETEWRPLSSLPRHWMPFLNRKRGTPMDPRPKTTIPALADAIDDGAE